MTNVVGFKPRVSRQFLIGQAVVTSAAIHWPWGFEKFGTAKVLADIAAATEWQIGFFVDECRQEYWNLRRVYTEIDSVEDCAFTDPDFAAAVNGFAECHT